MDRRRFRTRTIPARSRAHREQCISAIAAVLSPELFLANRELAELLKPEPEELVIDLDATRQRRIEELEAELALLKAG